MEEVPEDLPCTHFFSCREDFFQSFNTNIMVTNYSLISALIYNFTREIIKIVKL